MPGGAPVGNTNATKAKPWRDALDRALAQDDGKKLRAAAEKLLSCAADGEAWAIKEIADRLDGKSVQPIEGDIDHTVIVEMVRFADKAA